MTRPSLRVAFGVAILVAVGLGYGVGWYEARGRISSEPSCAAASKDREAFLRKLNPTVELETVLWKDFGRSCLASYAYRTASPSGALVERSFVLDMQTGKNILQFQGGSAPSPSSEKGTQSSSLIGI